MIKTWYGPGISIKEKLKRTTSAFLSATYHVLFWPLEMHRKKFLCETKYLTSRGKERVQARLDLSLHDQGVFYNHRLESKNASILSGRSRMIEVCTESSFQPLLQLYLFLPTGVVTFRSLGSHARDESASEFFSSMAQLQFWSILSSCFSLAWSFTFYQSFKKNGALDFGANALGRILLLSSNILQVSSRLVAFVLFAYCCGDGNIWPAFVFVLIHIIVISLYHCYEILSSGRTNDCEPLTMAAVFQSILNGIGNLYMTNLILPSPSEEEKKQLVRQKLSTRKRQLVVDGLLTAENLVILVIAGVVLDFDDVWPLLVFVLSAQVLGLLLKGLYYKFFHIWSLILPTKGDSSESA